VQKINLLQQIVALQLSCAWQLNYSTKKSRQAAPMGSLCILLCLWL